MMFSLVLVSEGVTAADENCGANMKEVVAITDRKFPNMGTDHIKRYLGEWNYGSMASITISEGRKFVAMGKNVLICPRADKKFDVLWAHSKEKVGILGMVTRNQVMVYQTSFGDIGFDRAGTMTAGR
jgi:hypothetical protein